MRRTFGLTVSETVVPIAADEVAHDTDAIVQRVAQAFPDRAAAARALLLERTQRYVQDVLPGYWRCASTTAPMQVGLQGQQSGVCTRRRTGVDQPRQCWAHSAHV